MIRNLPRFSRRFAFPVLTCLTLLLTCNPLRAAVIWVEGEKPVKSSSSAIRGGTTRSTAISSPAATSSQTGAISRAKPNIPSRRRRPGNTISGPAPIPSAPNFPTDSTPDPGRKST